ncbi:MAG: cysteine desulfurase [Proteobacteria bacterium]|jgi:cysteine desulfurase|nr:cysteine desulfurase [Pseudomonadota bacterium]
MSRLYFDHNATSPLRPEVKDALLSFIGTTYGNPSSVHGSGRAIRAKIDEARENVAKLVGANTLEIIFTSSGVEANHLAWNAFQMEGKRIATTTTEHKCIVGAVTKAEVCGAQVHQINIEPDGSISEKSLQSLVEFKPNFVSIHHANNETGALYPIADFSKRLRELSCFFHSDAVQAVGKSGVNVADLGVNYLSISGHKLGALQGVGALYVKKGSPLKSLWPGGAQEKGLRAGTENVVGIISMGTAAKVILNQGETERNRLKKLRDDFEAGLMARIKDISISAQDHPRLPNTSHVIFNNVDAESLLMAADLDSLDLATGSACSSGSLEPSKVVLAMGVDRERAKGAVRFSFGWNTTQDDIAKALQILPKLVEQIRKLKQ